jgi:hypothetical protein
MSPAEMKSADRHSTSACPTGPPAVSATTERIVSRSHCWAGSWSIDTLATTSTLHDDNAVCLDDCFGLLSDIATILRRADAVILEWWRAWTR